ncbi:hypothetical protein BCV70DRAFT_139306, partial [Testicularia cyperi]
PDGSSSSGRSRPPLDPTVSVANAIQKSRKPWIIAVKDSVLGGISTFLLHAIPDPSYFSYDLDQFDDAQSSGSVSPDTGLIGDGAGLNWGGSTLEVVRSQAIFLTRSAAFGPRIVSDQGLRGFLLPVSDFYHMPNDHDSKSANTDIQACSYRGGPGWRDQDLLAKYDNHDDRRLYSGFVRGSDHSRSSASSTYAVSNGSMPRPPENWIALVERGGGCGFAAKVRVAQDLGAIAVVVGDAPSPNWHGGKNGDPNEEGDPGLSGKRLITMFAPGDTSDIRIPSTFVTRPSFLDLQRLIDETEKDEQQWNHQHPIPDGDKNRHDRSHGLEIVIGKDDLVWEWPLIDLGILLLLLPSFMTIITIIIHKVRMIRQRRKERAPELVVLGLPCLIWRGNGQPWEKIEGPDTDPGPGNGASVPSPTTSSSPPPPNGRPSESEDLEAGLLGAETIPLLEEDENGAGPSQRTKTVAVAVAVPRVPASSTRQGPSSLLPPGRTYFSTDECAICLCDFVDGDRIRVLPCGHIFHRQEIDDWLVRVKKLCPICKRDITVPVPPAPPVG